VTSLAVESDQALQPEVASFDPAKRYADARKRVVYDSGELVPYYSRILEKLGLEKPAKDKCGFDQLVSTPDGRLVAVTRNCRQPTCHRCMARKLAVQATAILTLPLRAQDGTLGPAFCGRILYLGQLPDGKSGLAAYKKAWQRGQVAGIKAMSFVSSTTLDNVIVEKKQRTSLQSPEVTSVQQATSQIDYDSSIHGYIIFDAHNPRGRDQRAPGTWVLATASWGLRSPTVLAAPRAPNHPIEPTPSDADPDPAETQALRATVFGLIIATIDVLKPTATGIEPFRLDDDDDPVWVARMQGRIHHSRSICLDPQTICSTDCKVATEDPVTLGEFQAACHHEGVAVSDKYNSHPESSWITHVASVSAPVTDEAKRQRIIEIATGSYRTPPDCTAGLAELEEAV